MTIAPYNFIPNNDDEEIILLREQLFEKNYCKFYKSDIKIWFSIESLLIVWKYPNGLHQHILIEDAPEERWEPTNICRTFF